MVVGVSAKEYVLPSQLAIDITERLRRQHRDCPDFPHGACVLRVIFTDDVQEILDLADELRAEAG